MNKIFKVGLIGCGHIAETYFRAQKYFNNIKIIKCADINNKVAKKCATKYGIKSVSVNEILNDKEVEIILNLTTCLLYTSPSPRDQRGSRMPSSA